MTRKRIVCMGFMGRCPIAGVIWQHVHYIVGLLRLGHDVTYVEDTLSPCYNPVKFDWGDDYSYAAQTLARLAAEYGFENHWAYCARNTPAQDCVGMTRAQLRDLYANADAILNICGAQELNDDILRSDCLIYVESDPGVEQIKVDSGNADTREYLSKHRKLFTFAERIGTPHFPVPLHGFEWLPTRQPVVTDLWRSPAPDPASTIYTTIANWSTSGKKDITWRGETYLWSKSLEFLKFIAAPAAVGEPLELATDIPDLPIRQKFLDAGWRFTPPHEMSADWDLYRRYIQNSRGEFTVAKDQYVRLSTGWFSDRTACYLASGRPAITQATGFTDFYGGRGGLFAFETLDDIAHAAAQIRSDYPAHCRAAADVAREAFEAEKVLASLLERAGV